MAPMRPGDRRRDDRAALRAGCHGWSPARCPTSHGGWQDGMTPDQRRPSSVELGPGWFRILAVASQAPASRPPRQSAPVWPSSSSMARRRPSTSGPTAASNAVRQAGRLLVGEHPRTAISLALTPGVTLGPGGSASILAFSGSACGGRSAILSAVPTGPSRPGGAGSCWDRTAPARRPCCASPPATWSPSDGRSSCCRADWSRTFDIRAVRGPDRARRCRRLDALHRRGSRTPLEIVVDRRPRAPRPVVGSVRTDASGAERGRSSSRLAAAPWSSTRARSLRAASGNGRSSPSQHARPGTCWSSTSHAGLDIAGREDLIAAHRRAGSRRPTGGHRPSSSITSRRSRRLRPRAAAVGNGSSPAARSTHVIAFVTHLGVPAVAELDKSVHQDGQRWVVRRAPPPPIIDIRPAKRRSSRAPSRKLSTSSDSLGSRRRWARSRPMATQAALAAAGGAQLRWRRRSLAPTLSSSARFPSDRALPRPRSDHPQHRAPSSKRRRGRRRSLFLAMRYVEGTGPRLSTSAARALAPGRIIGLLARASPTPSMPPTRAASSIATSSPRILLVAPGQRAESTHYPSDFGLTKRLGSSDALTRTGPGHRLEVGYPAPEAIEGGSVDHRADIYSLGCVLFAALSGHPPTSATPIWPSSGRTSRPSHRRWRPSSRRWRRSTRSSARALAKDPEARFASAGELTDAAGAAMGVAVPRVGASTPLR